MAEDKNQWNAKGVSDNLKNGLSELEAEYGPRWRVLEFLLDNYNMQKIKTGELKSVEQATLDAISGDFKSLDELTRAIQRVFLGMVEKLGYRESEAVKEADELKVRIETLIQQHDEKIKEHKENEESLLKQLQTLRLEHSALQKDAALFEEKEKNLLEKVELKESEAKQYLDRIAKLDSRISEMEPLQEENKQLQAQLQEKETLLVAKENEHRHSLEVLRLQHENELSGKIKDAKEEVSNESSLKLEALRDKLEQQTEKKVSQAREDERKQSEKYVSDLRQQLKSSHDEEMAKLKKSFDELLVKSNKLKEAYEKEKAKNKNDEEKKEN